MKKKIITFGKTSKAIYKIYSHFQRKNALPALYANWSSWHHVFGESICNVAPDEDLPFFTG